MRSLRIQGDGAGDPAFAWVGLSYVLPQGGAEMDAGSFEKIYVVLAGTVTVIFGDGVRHVLGPLDSCHIDAGEARALVNDTNSVVTMLVIAPRAAPVISPRP